MQMSKVSSFGYNLYELLLFVDGNLYFMFKYYRIRVD